MKKAKILLIIVFAFTGLTSIAQQNKLPIKCSDSCCSDNAGKNTNKVSLTAMETQKPAKVIACKLTSPELQKRKEEVIASLKKKVSQKTEIENGYRYSFAASDLLTDELISFIKTEKQCCDFFEFSLTFLEEETLLSITGPNGAKEFIREELNF